MSKWALGVGWGSWQSSCARGAGGSQRFLMNLWLILCPEQLVFSACGTPKKGCWNGINWFHFMSITEVPSTCKTYTPRGHFYASLVAGRRPVFWSELFCSKEAWAFFLTKSQEFGSYHSTFCWLCSSNSVCNSLCIRPFTSKQLVRYLTVSQVLEKSTMAPIRSHRK